MSRSSKTPLSFRPLRSGPPPKKDNPKSTREKPNEKRKQAFCTLVQRPFRHRHDARQLLLAATDYVQSDVVKQWRRYADNNWHCLLEAEYALYPRAREYDFLQNWVPLLAILVEVKDQCPRDDLQWALEELFSHPTFLWEQGVDLLTSLMEGDESLPTSEPPTSSASARYAPDDEFQYESLGDVLRPLLHVLWLMRKHIRDAEHNEPFQELVRQVGEWMEQSPHEMGTNLPECQNLLRRLDPVALPPSASKSISSRVPPRVLRPVPPSQLPGSLRSTEEGEVLERRHANDHEHITQIDVIPPACELLCREPSYLPRDDDRMDWIEDPMEAHLDRQFRLTREDVMLVFREAVNYFMREIYKPPGLPPTVASFPFRSQSGTSSRVRVYHGVQSALVTEPCQVLGRLSFDIPGATKAEKNEFWKRSFGSALLPRGQLIAFVSCLGNEWAVALGTVEHLPSGRDQVDYPHRGHLGFLPHHLQDYLYWQHSMESEGSHNYILEVRGHFSKTPFDVLRSLKGLVGESLELAVPLGLLGEEAMIRYQEGPPPYLLQRRLSLAPILHPNAPRDQEISWDELPGGFEETYQALWERKEDLCLDDTQIAAFAAGITQRVALIQGPPGTGKSYVGIKLAQFLLRNALPRSVLTDYRLGMGGRRDLPILCICFTNPALDQFLRDLIESGVSSTDVIRLGRPSTDLLLSQCKPSRRNLPYFHKVREELEEQFDHISDGFCFRANSMRVENLEEWLEYWEEEAYENLREPFAGILDDLTFTNNKIKSFADVLHLWVQHKEREDFGPFFPPETRATFPWNLSKSERQALYHAWTRQAREEEFPALQTDYERCCRVTDKMKDLRNRSDILEAKYAKVVGMTTSACASHRDLILELNPQVIICEEAGEVLESHLLGALCTETTHLILIGDHQQLRPKVNEYQFTRDARQGCSLDISLFERLVLSYQRHLSDEEMRATGKLVTLSTQRRMRPSISSFIRPLYPHLQDHPRVCEYPSVRGMACPLWFYDHSMPQRGGQDAGSYTNPHEAEAVVSLVRYLMRNGYHHKQHLAVITPYLGQLMLLRQLMAREKLTTDLSEFDKEQIALRETEDGAQNSEEKEEVRGNELPLESIQEMDKKQNKQEDKKQKSQVVSMNSVRLSTVDNFQGEEADVIVLSLVRSNEEGAIGFLKTPHRVNVMLSRAKHGMIILGSSQTMLHNEKNQRSLLGQCIRSLQQQQLAGPSFPLQCTNHNTMQHVTTSGLRSLSRDGGCEEPCLARLDCGHMCPRLCHPDDRDHQAFVCREPCPNMALCQVHPCQKLCWEVCRCDVEITITLPCGHEKKVPCHQKDQDHPCQVLLPLETSCSHSLSIRCHIQLHGTPEQKTEASQCQQRCGCALADCEHPCPNPCFQCEHNSTATYPPLPAQCNVPTPHILDCGHSCDGLCGHSQAECPPCQKPCQTQCSHSHCAYRCDQACSLCAEPCSWACTHPPTEEKPRLVCSGFCGSPCTRLPCNERCSLLMSCGHPCTGLCGEPCPEPEAACPQCVSKACADRSICVLDSDLSVEAPTWDPTQDPIIQLGCGHVWTVDTLDGIFFMHEFYEQDHLGQWTARKPVHLGHVAELDLHPRCPTCHHPISHVKRYGCPLNYLQVIRVQRKLLREALAYIQTLEKNSPPKTMGRLKEEVKKLRARDPTRRLSQRMKRQAIEEGKEGDQAQWPIMHYRQPFILILLAIARLYSSSIPPKALVILCQQCKDEKLDASYKEAKYFLLQALERNPSQLDPIRPLVESLEDEELTQVLNDKNQILEIIRAMQPDIGSGVGSLGGHWYQCPNNHIYTIGECGGAMETSSCPECGATIGGRNHSLTEGNRPALDFLRANGQDHLVPSNRAYW